MVTINIQWNFHFNIIHFTYTTHSEFCFDLPISQRKTYLQLSERVLLLFSFEEVSRSLDEVEEDFLNGRLLALPLVRVTKA